MDNQNVLQCCFILKYCSINSVEFQPLLKACTHESYSAAFYRLEVIKFGN